MMMPTLLHAIHNNCPMSRVTSVGLIEDFLVAISGGNWFFLQIEDFMGLIFIRRSDRLMILGGMFEIAPELSSIYIWRGKWLK
ncbi:hypothetical protein D3C73_959270 [compost metagenome]